MISQAMLARAEVRDDNKVIKRGRKTTEYQNKMMRIIMKRFAFATALALLTSMAQAANDQIEIFNNGVWRTNYFGNDTAEASMCEMDTTVRWEDQTEGVFMVKWTAKDGMFLQFAKTSWSMRMPQDMVITLAFDRRRITGVGRNVGATTYGDVVLQMNVTPRDVFNILHEVHAAGWMLLEFPNYEQDTWVVKMNGGKAVAAFMGCMSSVEASIKSPPPVKK